jgi:hypothetical protein
MRISPIALHAMLRIPSLSDYFSDPLAVTRLVVVPGAKVTLTCAAPHGVAIGKRIALSIVDAPRPNRITAATVDADGFVTLTVTDDHDQTLPPGHFYDNRFVTLSGFANPGLNGDVLMVAIHDRRTIVVKPNAPVAAVTMTTNEALQERLDGEIIGWHAMVADTSTTLSFTTPAHITAGYTVTDPIVVRNIRIWGAVNYEWARKNFVRKDADSLELKKAAMFICPLETVSVSKDRRVNSDALTELTPGSDFRQLIVDGFKVVVFCPGEQSAAGVTCSDLCHGHLFETVLKTFNGYKPQSRSELFQGTDFVAFLAQHSALEFDGANYVHEYSFSAPGYLTRCDSVMPWQIANLDDDATAPPGGTPPSSVTQVGSVAFRGINFGIRHDDADGALTANVQIV